MRWGVVGNSLPSVFLVKLQSILKILRGARYDMSLVPPAGPNLHSIILGLTDIEIVMRQDGGFMLWTQWDHSYRKYKVIATSSLW